MRVDVASSAARRLRRLIRHPTLPPRPAGLRRLAVRALLAALVVAAPLWAGDGAVGATPVDRGLEVVARPYAFSLARWEVRALGDGALRLVRPGWSPGANPEADREVVRRYCELTGDLRRLQDERDRAEATEAEPARTERMSAISRQAETVRSERRALAAPVEAVVAWQIEQVLAEQGIRRGLVEVRGQPEFPFVSTAITPGVAFELGQTPDLLVVSPRDRIELVGSVLLDPGLDYEEVDRIEASADRLGVASLVTPIGGLAAYPSMVPASSSVRATLRTISHEWIHHYLAFRPLGAAYFGSYEMRTINETVADLAGEELADLVYDRYYADPGAQPPAPSDAGASQPGPTFGDLMRDIRVEVERYLARGDVAGAEAYMAAEKRALADQGYYVRRLNTAYLSFFGAYAGTANPYEAKLRAVRQASGSLRAFLEAASAVGSPADLDALGVKDEQ